MPVLGSSLGESQTGSDEVVPRRAAPRAQLAGHERARAAQLRGALESTGLELSADQLEMLSAEGIAGEASLEAFVEKCFLGRLEMRRRHHRLPHPKRS